MKPNNKKPVKEHLLGIDSNDDTEHSFLSAGLADHEDGRFSVVKKLSFSTYRKLIENTTDDGRFSLGRKQSFAKLEHTFQDTDCVSVTGSCLGSRGLLGNRLPRVGKKSRMKLRNRSNTESYSPPRDEKRHDLTVPRSETATTTCDYSSAGSNETAESPSKENLPDSARGEGGAGNGLIAVYIEHRQWSQLCRYLQTRCGQQEVLRQAERTNAAILTRRSESEQSDGSGRDTLAVGSVGPSILRRNVTGASEPDPTTNKCELARASYSAGRTTYLHELCRLFNTDSYHGHIRSPSSDYINALSTVLTIHPRSISLPSVGDGNNTPLHALFRYHGSARKERERITRRNGNDTSEKVLDEQKMTRIEEAHLLRDIVAFFLLKYTEIGTFQGRIKANKRKGTRLLMARNDYGQTPLHMAALHQCPPVVINFLAHACPKAAAVRAKGGETSLDYVLRRRRDVRKNNNRNEERMCIEELQDENEQIIEMLRLALQKVNADPSPAESKCEGGACSPTEKKTEVGFCHATSDRVESNGAGEGKEGRDDEVVPQLSGQEQQQPWAEQKSCGSPVQDEVNFFHPDDLAANFSLADGLGDSFENSWNSWKGDEDVGDNQFPLEKDSGNEAFDPNPSVSVTLEPESPCGSSVPVGENREGGSDEQRTEEHPAPVFSDKDTFENIWDGNEGKINNDRPLGEHRNETEAAGPNSLVSNSSEGQHQIQSNVGITEESSTGNKKKSQELVTADSVQDSFEKIWETDQGQSDLGDLPLARQEQKDNRKESADPNSFVFDACWEEKFQCDSKTGEPLIPSEEKKDEGRDDEDMASTVPEQKQRQPCEQQSSSSEPFKHGSFVKSNELQAKPDSQDAALASGSPVPENVPEKSFQEIWKVDGGDLKEADFPYFAGDRRVESPEPDEAGRCEF